MFRASGCVVVILAVASIAIAAEPTIRVDAAAKPSQSTLLTGVCLEDVNHEIYGGLDSQMIFGESFAEPAGKSDVSKMWSPITSGEAELSATLVHDHPFVGAQSQRLSFVRGSGEVGLINRGLNGQGMVFRNRSDYEGYLWLRAAQPTQVVVSFESSTEAHHDFTRQTLAVAGGDQWQRCDFKLQIDAAAAAFSRGQFTIRLTSPGSIDIGYAFLQPGSWGRFHNQPVRADVAETMLTQHLGFIRYGGSMVNVPGYRWKNMLGPREHRPPYKGNWYDYASNGWGIIDFLNFCEAADVIAVPDFNIDESPQDMLDFIDYANGPANSEWGKRRVADGHPQPYNVRYIELGNEEKVNADYLAKFAKVAAAIWSKDKQLVPIVGDFAYRDPIHDPFQITGADSGIASLAAHQKILNLAREHDAEVWFDVHVWSEALPPSPSAKAITSYIDAIDKLANGAKHRVVVFELNANKHDLGRALANTDVMIDLFRDGRMPMISSANALQVDGQNDNGWDQGLVFLNPDKTWTQPPGDALMMFPGNRRVAPVPSEANGGSLKVAAARHTDGPELYLLVLNADAQPCTATVQIDGYAPTKPLAHVSELTGSLDAVNTAQDIWHIGPSVTDWPHAADGQPNRFTFKVHSITLFLFE